MRRTATFNCGIRVSQRDEVISDAGKAIAMDPAGSPGSPKNGIAMLATSSSNVFLVWENPCARNCSANRFNSAFDVTVMGVIFSRFSENMRSAVSLVAKARKTSPDAVAW